VARRGLQLAFPDVRDGDGKPARPIEFGRGVQLIRSSGLAIRDTAGPRAILYLPRVTKTQEEGELITTVCAVCSARVSTAPLLPL